MAEQWNKLRFDRHVRGLGKRLTHAEHRVLTTMASYADPDGTNVFVSLKRLADDCGMTKETVITARESLEAKGLLQCVYRGGRGRGNSSRYRVLNVPKALLPGDKKVGSTDPLTDHKRSDREREKVGSDGKKRSAEPTRPTPVPTPIDQQHARAKPSLDADDPAAQLVRSVIPDNRYSRQTIRGLRRRVEQMLADDNDPEMIRRGLRQWDSRPDARTPALLPNLVDDETKANKPAGPTARPPTAWDRKALAGLKVLLSHATRPDQVPDRRYLVDHYGDWAVTTVERELTATLRDDNRVVDAQVVDVTYEPELPSAQGDTP